MSYLGNFKLNDSIYFTCTTHNTSGNSYNADSSPAWRCYKQGDSSPLLTGTMTALDSANVVGNYYGSFTALSSAGFAVDKEYYVVIKASVLGVSGTTNRYFQIKTIDANIVSTNAMSIETTAFVDPIPADIFNVSTPFNDGNFDATFYTQVGSSVWVNPTRSLTDKSNFALTSGEHANIVTDVTSGLTTQGYTIIRANRIDALDATITSRLAANDYTTPPTTGAIATSVWNNGTRTLTDKANFSLSSAEHLVIQNDVNAGLVNQGYDSTRASKLDNLDATISSRSTLTSGQVATSVWSDPTRSLTSTERTAIAQSVLSSNIDGYTLEEVNKLVSAVLCGKSEINANIITFYGIDGVTARLTCNTDGEGVRNSITYNVS